MKQLITATEALKLVQRGTEELRESITEKLDANIRRCVKDGNNEMTINICTNNIIKHGHKQVIEDILTNAGYIVMSIEYKIPNDQRDHRATAYFIIKIALKPTGSYQSR